MLKRTASKTFLISAGLLFLLSANVFALLPTKPITQYVHTVWQTDDGLPQNYVVAVVQTRDGYLWLATQEGLVRFDGVKFTVFDKHNTEQIKDNNIQALCEDQEGNLWFGTEGSGLIRYREGEFIAYSSQDGLSGDIVDAIFQDQEGNLWIGTLDGLSCFKNGTFLNYHTKDGLANNTVLAIYEDQRGNLWIGTENGLNRFKDGRFTTYTTKDGLADNLIRSICEDQKGNLWIGTRNGLSRLKNDKFTTYSVKQGLANNSVLSLYKDRDSNLWVGTDGGGLSRLQDNGFTTYSKKDGLSDDSVASISEDREGNLWIGTYGGGLNRLKDGRFVTYTPEHGLSDDMVRAICEDQKGNLWIGTRNGLNRLKDGKISTYTTRQGLVHNSVLSLCEDYKGDLWIGTRGGLNRFQNGKFVTYSTKDGLSDNTVLAVIEDGSQGLWIGTGGGLSRWKKGKFTSFTTTDGLTNDSIWALYLDSGGSLWIGTEGGGLNRWKDGRFSAYTTKDGLANNVVMAIYEDQQSNLWIGTSGGLSRFRDGRFVTCRSKDGLFDDSIFQILEDAGGYLWMSCNKGIFCVSKQQLDDFFAGKTASIMSTPYGTADGMANRECNGGFQPAGWKTTDGKLWFPTIKGATMIDPHSIRINELIPPVIIEQVIVDSASVDLNQERQFAAGKEKFEFHFTGLSFIAPEKVQFKYKLEGFDKDWVYAGNRRDISYTNIPPGRYVFKVLACNNDLVWNERGASFEFYLKPHFHQTYWFYALCLLATGLLGWGIYRFRVRQMQMRFSAVLAERSRLAREIHDTLTQCFVGIGLQLETVSGTLKQSPQMAEQHLQLARKMVRNSLAEARRSVWEMRSQALENSDLAGVLSETLQQMTGATSVQGEFQVYGKPTRLAKTVEMNLLRIGQEALANAIKHAQPDKVRIELTFTPQTTQLRVIDNGRGFEVQSLLSASSGSFGLVGMRERADQMNAQLTIQSVPGVGTEIEITVMMDSMEEDS